MHQSDLTPMPHDKIGNRVFKYRLIIKDVATRYRKSYALTNRSASTVAKAIMKIPTILFLGLMFLEPIKVLTERDHQEFDKHAFILQDAIDFYLPMSNRSRAWVKGLYINDDIYNDTSTRLIHMSPNEAVKKALKGEKIIADPSGLGLGLGFGRRRITDVNWSPKVYRIKESLIQKNQPVLYWLMDENGDGPERSFVREQLMKVVNIEYPPRWILRDQY
ncbi:3157_t:CDS:2 [Acaulospora colombiana]|uniref:3157_t:CDS:1 n=1 Tax=Acaulospora colombiana TaxID=27376 RepID=A0ACA9JV56_9GLOM|nr:3157_t:CDS:2 [Acaulospora colombiana]